VEVLSADQLPKRRSNFSHVDPQVVVVVLLLLPHCDVMWRSTTVSGTSLLRSQCSNACLAPPYGGTAMHILQVELWTQPQHRMYTSVKRATRSPSWRGQRLEVLVQEPGSQQLQVVLHDVDVLNVKVTPMHMMTWHMTCASHSIYAQLTAPASAGHW
jgi:hypothetical protein